MERRGRCVAALKSQAYAVKLTFGLLTDLVTGFPSASGFVLLLQISIFALPVIQGFPGDPLVAFAWSLAVAYLHAGSLFHTITIVPTVTGPNGFKSERPRRRSRAELGATWQHKEHVC
jgi:hypothetical protein